MYTVSIPCLTLNRDRSLLCVHHDIVAALEMGSYVALIMLDLSAAFDVIDHPILIRRVEFAFGISCSALDWIKSYLSERTQKVAIGSTFSNDFCLNCGVPQLKLT